MLELCAPKTSLTKAVNKAINQQTIHKPYILRKHNIFTPTQDIEGLKSAHTHTSASLAALIFWFYAATKSPLYNEMHSNLVL